MGRSDRWAGSLSQILAAGRVGPVADALAGLLGSVDAANGAHDEDERHGDDHGRGQRREGLGEVAAHDCSGRSSGNAIVSRIGRPVSSRISRSMPIPTPP